MSLQIEIVDSRQFQNIMLGLQQAFLMIGEDIPAVGDVLRVGMNEEQPLAEPYLRVRVTNVEMLNSAWHVEYANLDAGQVAVVSFNLGLEL